MSAFFKRKERNGMERIYVHYTYIHNKEKQTRSFWYNVMWPGKEQERE